MQYLAYLALIATVDAKWTPFKDLKAFHEKHPEPLKEWASHHKHPLKDAIKLISKEINTLTKTEEEVELDRIKLVAIVSGVLKGAL